jgi:hypothetical protein
VQVFLVALVIAFDPMPVGAIAGMNAESAFAAFRLSMSRRSGSRLR